MSTLHHQQVPHGQNARARVASNNPRPNPSAAPTISYTPTDTNIPVKLYDKIPNLELYKQLKEAEDKISHLISMKALDFQAIQQSTVQPSNFKRETGILRVFVYNTCENQPWQKQLLQEQGESVPESESSWTLRVEGRFLGDSDTESSTFKFSNFLSGISVDIIPNEDYPELQNAQSNIIEWRNESDVLKNGSVQTEFDGLDVKRNGVYNLNAKLAILIKEPTAAIKLSDEMAHFVGKRESNQQEIIYLIWQYALYKDLFKKGPVPTKVPAVSTVSGYVDNGTKETTDDEEITLIICDEVLKSLLHVESFRFSEIYKLLQSHFKPREPIIIDYEINTRKSSTLGEVVLDIPVELPAQISKIQRDLVDFNRSTFESLTKSDNLIQSLNNKISLGVAALQNASMREQFYKELSEDPVKFIESWIESQSETLRALRSDEGYDEELVRRAKYFEDNEDLLKEKIDLLLGSTRF